MPRPLEGLRVIDAGTRISAPFCAGLLGEQGADVIKVELPGAGDFMRQIGPFVDDYSLFWAVEGRGRRSVTCDLRRPEGQDLFRRLAGHADVVCENFRPGTMEAWNVGPSDLDPRIVYVRISVFGQDGPYSRRPGLDRMGIGYGGLLFLTGYPDRPPVRPGVTVSDYLTGVFAAQAATAALYARDAGGAGSGAVIDAALYGSVLRILEWTMAGYDRLGVVRGREGNRLANSAPLDNYLAADGRYVCIVAGSDANDEINGIVAEWVAARESKDIEEACIAHDVPVATAFSAADIAGDPHIAARGDLVAVDDPELGPLRQQAPFPRFAGEPAVVPAGAPRLGEHNREVWCGLVGLTDHELDACIADGII